jgi:predicted nucleotidyltransferase
MGIRQLLKSLLDHKVRFLIIGGWALPAYGLERMTKDVDIFIEPTEKNALRTKEALKEVGYEIVNGVDVSVFLKKKVLIQQYILRTDIHPFVAGSSFRDAWANRVKTKIKGLNVFVPSLKDLIRMKESAGREQDMLDVKMLREIQRHARPRTKN